MNIDLYQGDRLPSLLVACLQVVVAGDQCTAFRIVATPAKPHDLSDVDVVQVLFDSISQHFEETQGASAPLMLSGAIDKDRMVTVTGTVLRESSRHGHVVRDVQSALATVEARHGLSAKVKFWATRGIKDDGKVSKFVDQLDCGPQARTCFNEAALSLLEDFPEDLAEFAVSPTIH